MNAECGVRSAECEWRMWNARVVASGFSRTRDMAVVVSGFSWSRNVRPQTDSSGNQEAIEL